MIEDLIKIRFHDESSFECCLLYQYLEHTLFTSSRICSTFTFLVFIGALSHLGVACTPDPKSMDASSKAKSKSSSKVTSTPVTQAVIAPTGKIPSAAMLGTLTSGKTSGAKLTREGDTFIVHLPQATEGVSSALKIESKLGYKVNENFPHRAEFKVGPTQKITAQTKKEKHRLTFTTAEGDISKIGTSVALSFSICNDQMCKLYDETYQW